MTRKFSYKFIDSDMHSLFLIELEDRLNLGMQTKKISIQIKFYNSINFLGSIFI